MNGIISEDEIPHCATGRILWRKRGRWWRTAGEVVHGSFSWVYRVVFDGGSPSLQGHTFSESVIPMSVT